MLPRRLYVCLVILAVILIPGLAPAQSLPDIPTAQSLPEPPPAPIAEPAAEEVVPRESILRVRPNTVTSGDKGDVILDGSAPGFTTEGIFMRANTTALPNISAKLGTSDANSLFSIFDSANSRLWFVRGDGLARLAKDHNSGTIIDIANSNPGTSAASAWTNLRFIEGAAVKARVTSVGSGSSGFQGGANSFHLWNSANGPILLGTNNAERVRIEANGNIGIDVGYPATGKLHVVDRRDNGSALEVFTGSTIEQNTSQRDRAAFIATYQTVNAGITNSDAIIGLQVAASKVGAGNVNYAVGQEIHVGNMTGHSGTVTNSQGLAFYFSAGAGTLANAHAIIINDIPAANAWGIWQAGANDKNYFAGKVGIGTPPTVASALEVVGNVNIQGTLTGTNIQANYQDLAEWVPATSDMAPGTVVILNPHKINEVMPSSGAYDTSVAGVVSAQPGILLGEAGPSKEQIATTGRVKVRVDATAGAIRIGDLLVTGTKPGVAMKSAPLDFNGVPLHRPGTVLGKALEPLASGEGEILVLLSLQ